MRKSSCRHVPLRSPNQLAIHDLSRFVPIVDSSSRSARNIPIMAQSPKFVCAWPVCKFRLAWIWFQKCSVHSCRRQLTRYSSLERPDDLTFAISAISRRQLTYSFSFARPDGHTFTIGAFSRRQLTYSFCPCDRQYLTPGNVPFCPLVNFSSLNFIVILNFVFRVGCGPVAKFSLVIVQTLCGRCSRWPHFSFV